MMITAILVDDEAKSLMNLQHLIGEHCPEIKVIATATNALEAVTKVLSEKPDVLFLDVQMPGYNGFDVLEQVKSTGLTIIFTTAHRDYAINALRKGAFDYLLKPIDSDELRNCCEQIIAQLNRVRGEQSASSGIIELSVKDGIIFIKPEHVVRVEASGSYTIFFLDNNVKHLVSRSMKEYEGLLPPALFYRCHNSHIVNLSKVTKFISNNGYFAEMSNGSVIEIARKNKETFLERLKKLGR
jgi:two-component system LytT family response regulator